MKKEITKSIINSYPQVYQKNFVFKVGNGWENLIRDFSKDFDNLVKKAKKSKKIDEISGPPRVDAIRNKFAGLRVYVSGLSTNQKIQSSIQRLIQKTEERSYFVCEFCGQAAKIRAYPNYRTLCDSHAEKPKDTKSV
jgi:hypothetical protein